MAAGNALARSMAASRLARARKGHNGPVAPHPAAGALTNPGGMQDILAPGDEPGAAVATDGYGPPDETEPVPAAVGKLAGSLKRFALKKARGR